MRGPYTNHIYILCPPPLTPSLCLYIYGLVTVVGVGWDKEEEEEEEEGAWRSAGAIMMAATLGGGATMMVAIPII